MAKNNIISRALHANLNVEVYRVKDTTTYFGVSHKSGSIILDESSFILYLLLINSFPFDNLTTLNAKNGLSVIGGSNIITNTMMKPYYASNTSNPDPEHIVDTSYQIYTQSGYLTGDEITDHIDDMIGSPTWSNAHNLNAKADLYGNQLIKFDVANAENSYNAVNYQQFLNIKTNKWTPLTFGDFFLKGFWGDIGAKYPATDLISEQRGWYWIITKSDIDIDGREDWIEGDYIIYNGEGDGDNYESWIRQPAPAIDGGTFGK